MKAINGFFLISVLLLFFLTSCKKTDPEKLENDAAIRTKYYHLEKTGWKSRLYTQKVDDICFTAIEVPIEYYLLKDLGNENLFNVDSLYQANKKERVVEFSFQQDESKDLLQKDFTGLSYEATIKYMSFGLDKDFYVVTSEKDTIKCSGVSYERNFKVAPYQKVLLFFSGIDPNEKIQLIYTDYLFKKGTLKFKFKDNYTQIAL